MRIGRGDSSLVIDVVTFPMTFCDRSQLCFTIYKGMVGVNDLCDIHDRMWVIGIIHRTIMRGIAF